jgi:hypothetical protein
LIWEEAIVRIQSKLMASFHRPGYSFHCRLKT